MSKLFRYLLGFPCIFFGSLFITIALFSTGYALGAEYAIIAIGVFLCLAGVAIITVDPRKFRP